MPNNTTTANIAAGERTLATLATERDDPVIIEFYVKDVLRTNELMPDSYQDIDRKVIATVIIWVHF